MNKSMKNIFAAILLATAALGAQAKGGDTMPVGGGARLALDGRQLALVNRAGKPVATVALRAEQLDVRANDGRGLAVVLDAATQHARLLRFDVARGTLAPLPPLPVQAFGVESLCLFRDAQGLDYLFVAGRDGQAEQWLIEAASARLVRKLSMPLETEQCKVDDAAHALYVDEPKVGTWAYEANAEAVPARVLLKHGARLKARAERPLPVIAARAQTEPVARLGDVADDPAIWVSPRDVAQSRILGTNKKQGLMVYDLQGKQTQMLESGRLNNVDLRQGVQIDGQQFDLALATQRDDNTVVIYNIDANGWVAELARFPTGLAEVYGICLFQPRAGGLEVIVNDKSGLFRQYKLARSAGTWSGTQARAFRVATQPEGCVADDQAERLFIGEERRGVWTLGARADASSTPKPVLMVGRDLHADVEGMALYHGAKASYLVVSSQGDNSYVVLDALAPFRVRGRFRVGMNVAAGIDGTSETDGLDVTSRNLGVGYEQGMLVLQDGYKRLPDGPQNFKYVGWGDVATALGLD
jgi:3-phytase